MPYISFCDADGHNDEQHAVKQAAKDIVDYVDSHSRTSAPYSFYDYGSANVPNNSDEKQWIIDAVNYLDNNVTSAEHGETIFLPHGNETWGYGRSTPVEFDGGDTVVHGVSIYAGTWTYEWETYQMSWHEAGHSWARGSDSGHGRGNATYDSTNDRLVDVTPMASAYVRDSGGEPDTYWAGGGSVPSSFPSGDSNHQGDYPGSLDRSTIHRYQDYSVPVDKDLEDWEDNLFYG